MTFSSFSKSILFSFAILLSSVAVFAAETTYSTVAVNGYDLVSYHANGQPQEGNGAFASTYDGETYLFANKKHKETFDKNPKKYLPAYGGYCAYGAALGKKFVADPNVWEIVDGTLYLNLNKDIQSSWAKDVSGFIKKANKAWPTIKDKAPSDL